MTSERADIVAVYRDSAGEWRWKRRAPNGETLSMSSEGYVDEDYCIAQAMELNQGCVVYTNDDDG